MGLSKKDEQRRMNALRGALFGFRSQKEKLIPKKETKLAEIEANGQW
jgi:hypothetical protein